MLHVVLDTSWLHQPASSWLRNLQARLLCTSLPPQQHQHPLACAVHAAACTSSTLYVRLHDNHTTVQLCWTFSRKVRPAAPYTQSCDVLRGARTASHSKLKAVVWPCLSAHPHNEPTTQTNQRQRIL